MRRRLPAPALFVALAVTLWPALAHAAAGHGPDLEPLLLAFVLILLGARLGGELFERLHLPAVLGELAAGILIGNLDLMGFRAFEALNSLESLQVLAQVGVLFLLFSRARNDLSRCARSGRRRCWWRCWA